MRNRTLSLRNNALTSIQRITEECYDLANPVLVTPTKHLLCQTELITRTTPQIDDIASSRNSICQANYTTARSRRAPSISHIPLQQTNNKIQTTAHQIIFQRLYKAKLVQSQSKFNKKQEAIFISKLSKALKGKQFDGTGCDIGPLGVKQICNFFINNNIEVLVLDRNHLRDDGIRQLASVVGRMPLKVLSLQSVGMGESGCKMLIPELAKIQTLDTLSFGSNEGVNRNKLNKQALKDIHLLTCSGVGHANLRVLNLANVGLDDRNFLYLCTGLGRGSRIQHLSIQNNQITSIGMVGFHEHAVKLHLKYLNISNNKIDGGGLNQLSSLIGTGYNLTKISKTLHSVKVNNAKIHSIHLSNFTKFISNNQILTELYLDHNFLRQGGCFGDFCGFLRRNWTIKVLSLRQSLRSTDDLMSIFDCLQFNRGIETLYLSKNNIELCAFKILMQILGRNKSLKKLHIDGCGIVDSFISKSREEIMEMKSIEEIYMDHNYINDNGAAILEQAIFRNKQISKCELLSNCLSVKMAQQICRALSFNEEMKKLDKPDLSYYLYIQELQSNLKTSLQENINELKQKESKMQYKHLVHTIAKKDLEKASKQVEIQKQIEEVNKITELKANMMRIAELEKIVDMNGMGKPSASSISQDPKIADFQLSDVEGCISRQNSGNMSKQQSSYKS